MWKGSLERKALERPFKCLLLLGEINDQVAISECFTTLFIFTATSALVTKYLELTTASTLLLALIQSTMLPEKAGKTKAKMWGFFLSVIMSVGGPDDGWVGGLHKSQKLWAMKKKNKKNTADHRLQRKVAQISGSVCGYRAEKSNKHWGKQNGPAVGPFWNCSVFTSEPQQRS